MPMMTSQIVNLWTSQKQKNLDIENETLFFLQVKNSH